MLRNTPKIASNSKSDNLYHIGAKSLSTGLKIAVAGGILICLSLGGCGTYKYVPLETKSEVVYRDSTIIRVDTVKVPVPYEVHRDFGGLTDTLRFETSVAEAWAVADTSALMIRGELKNKEVSLKKEVVFKDRVVTRDSVVIKEVPVEVTKEVIKTPKWAFYCLAFSIICILGIIVKIYLKIKFGR